MRLNSCTVDRLRVKERGENLWVNGDQEAAVPSVDVDQRKFEDGVFHENGQGFPHSKGRGAADLVTGVALGDFRLARFDAIRADLAGQVF